MQAMVETSELGRAECIRRIQTIPAKYLNPYRKSFRNAVGCICIKRKIFTKTKLCSCLKKETDSPIWFILGYQTEIEKRSNNGAQNTIYYWKLKIYNCCERNRYRSGVQIIKSSTLNLQTRE